MSFFSRVVFGCAAVVTAAFFQPIELPGVAAPQVVGSKSSQPQERESQRGGHRFGLAAPLPRHAGAIRLATYNMLNFFDAEDDPNLQGEFDDIKMVTPPERCRELAAAIKTIDADIIALQEVESLEALTWFRDTYLPECNYTYLASKDVGYYRGVECSVMSRFPIVDQKVWLNESLDHVKREGIGWAPKPNDAAHLTFQRSPLMVTIQINDGYRLTVFSVHHKAGGRDFMYHREAEALRIVELIDELRAADPKRNIVVMGDFNSAPWDKSIRVYLKAGMADALNYRTTGRDDPETPLFKTHESDRVLDFVLLNAAAFNEYVPGSGFVFGTLTPPASYDYRKDKPPAGYASDHYPVVIDLVPRDQ
jgi:endonuclease/exonuclease/phosphatase family metal-dependent hydrolase